MKEIALSTRNIQIMKLMYQASDLRRRLRSMRHTAFIDVDGWRV